MRKLLEVVVPSSARSMQLRAAATVAWTQTVPVLVFALGTAGVLAQWGIRARGMLMLPASSTGQACVEIAAGWNHTMARYSDGSVAAWGDNTSGQCNVPA